MPKESADGERRIALVPEIVGKLVPGGFEVRVERGAGEAASFPDGSNSAYSASPKICCGVSSVRRSWS